MQWWSEAAVIWLPRGERPYPTDFAQRAAPGTNDFFYYALDAFGAVQQRLDGTDAAEPWIYVLEDRTLLSPQDISRLLPEWETARMQARAGVPGAAG